MPQDRFAPSDATRHDLADGKDWVSFRNMLNFGRDLRLTADTSVIEWVKEKDADGKEIQRRDGRIDWGIYQLHRLFAYLAEWSLVGPDEMTPIPISLETISGLDPDVGTEMVRLLDEHIAEQALKNSPK